MKLRWLTAVALVAFHGCSSEPDQSPGKTSFGGGAGSHGKDASLDTKQSGGAGGVILDAANDSDGCVYFIYAQPGCGGLAPNAVCQGGVAGGACAGLFCGCDGKNLDNGCGKPLEPYAYAGPCEEPDACVWMYALPGCDEKAPKPVCTDGTDDACTLPFCGCDGVTFMGGCGKSNVPFAAYGPCQGDGG